MENQIIFKRFEKLIEVGKLIAGPSVQQGGCAKISKFFVIFVVLQIAITIQSASHAFYYFDEMDLTALINSVALNLSFFRVSLYVISMAVKRFKLMDQIVKIVETRKATKPDNEAEWKMTLDYCKTEYTVAVGYSISVSAVFIFLVTGSVLLFPNENHLPTSAYFLFLPFDRVLSINWTLNYIFQAVTGSMIAIYLMAYFSLTSILMNHSCWVVDAAILSVNKLDDGAKMEDGTSAKKEGVPARKKEDFLVKKDELIKLLLKDVVEKCDAIGVWLNEAIGLMQLSFLADFSMVSSILCLCMFTITKEVSDPFYFLLVISVVLPQFFVHCYLGSRVNSRVETFSQAVFGVAWDRMRPKFRKDLLLVLAMSQHFKSFNGIFKKVDLAVFQGVLEFTYSMFALLKSTD